MLKLLYLIVIVAVLAAGYMASLDPSERNRLTSDISKEIETLEDDVTEAVTQVKDFVEQASHIKEDLDEHTKRLQDLVDGQ